MEERCSGSDDDRSGAGEEGYAAVCAGCEDSERNETRTLIIMLYFVKLG